MNNEKTLSNAPKGMQIDHVMIGVSNFDETLQWYKEKLGFLERRRWTNPAFPGVQIAYLELNGFVIEFISVIDSGCDPVSPSNINDIMQMKGLAHLCFRVNNVDEALAEFNQRGVPIFVAPENVPSVLRRVGFIRDNEGNLIEIAEPMR